MANGFLEHEAYREPDTGLPSRVKEVYDDAVKRAAKSLWRGMLKVAASGFGKGLLITVLAVVVGAGIIFGMGAYAHTLPPLMTALGPALPTVEQGVVHGIGKGLSFLMGSGGGLAALAVGGTLGAVSDIRKENSRLTAEMARAQEAEYERIRQRQPAAAQTVQPAVTPPSPMEQSFVAREAQRRSQPAQGTARIS